MLWISLLSEIMSTQNMPTHYVVWIVRIYAISGGGWIYSVFPHSTWGYNQTAAPHRDFLMSEPCWLWCWHASWHRVHCYFVYLTVAQAVHCSLFLPQCHLSPKTPYYANYSLHGYCSARLQCCHSSDWQLQNMCSMGCHLLQKHWFFSDMLFCLCVTLRFKHDTHTHTTHRNGERWRLCKRSRRRDGKFLPRISPTFLLVS